MKKLLISLKASRFVKVDFWLACLVITALSLSPIEMLKAPIFDWWDKAQHATAFLVLTCLGLFAYPNAYRRIIIGMLAFGIVIEIMQYFTGYRYAEVSDFLADLTGVTIGSLMMLQIEKRILKVT